MSADEDTELRDLVAQTLETNGVLGKIRAQLRASVFLALEEQESVKNKTPFLNPDLKKFVSTREGRQVAGLVREFLQYFNLDYSLAVFDPESGCSDYYDGRENLSRDFNIIESNETSKVPLLAEVLKQGTQSRGRLSNAEAGVGRDIPQGMSVSDIEEARKKFEEYDKDKNGSIDKGELRELFVDLFPSFHRNMLDRYVNDEFRSADKDFSNAIEFNEFLDMYKRLFVLCKSSVAQDVAELTMNSPRRLQSKIPSPMKKYPDDPLSPTNHAGVEHERSGSPLIPPSSPVELKENPLSLVRLPHLGALPPLSLPTSPSAHSPGVSEWTDSFSPLKPESVEAQEPEAATRMVDDDAKDDDTTETHTGDVASSSIRDEDTTLGDSSKSKKISKDTRNETTKTSKSLSYQSSASYSDSFQSVSSSKSHTADSKKKVQFKLEVRDEHGSHEQIQTVDNDVDGDVNERGDGTDEIMEEIEDETIVEEDLPEDDEEPVFKFDINSKVEIVDMAPPTASPDKSRKGSDPDIRSQLVRSPTKEPKSPGLSEYDDDSFFDEPVPNETKSFSSNQGRTSPSQAGSSPRGSPRSPRVSQIPRVSASAGDKKDAKSSGIPKPGSATTGLSSLAGLPSLGGNSPVPAEPKDTGSEADIKQIDQNLADLGVDVPEDEYDDDDFESSNISPYGQTPRSARSTHDVKSIEEDDDIEEDLDVEGYKDSDADDFLGSDISENGDLTTDRTISPRDQSNAFDYIEDVIQH